MNKIKKVLKKNKFIMKIWHLYKKHLFYKRNNDVKERCESGYVIIVDNIKNHNNYDFAINLQNSFGYNGYLNFIVSTDNDVDSKNPLILNINKFKFLKNDILILLNNNFDNCFLSFKNIKIKNKIIINLEQDNLIHLNNTKMNKITTYQINNSINITQNITLISESIIENKKYLVAKNELFILYFKALKIFLNNNASGSFVNYFNFEREVIYTK